MMLILKNDCNPHYDSFRLPLGLDSVRGEDFGSADFAAGLSVAADPEELLSELDLLDAESDFVSDLDSEAPDELLESEAADCL